MRGVPFARVTETAASSCRQSSSERSDLRYGKDLAIMTRTCAGLTPLGRKLVSRRSKSANPGWKGEKRSSCTTYCSMK